MQLQAIQCEEEKCGETGGGSGVASVPFRYARSSRPIPLRFEMVAPCVPVVAFEVAGGVRMVGHCGIPPTCLRRRRGL